MKLLFIEAKKKSFDFKDFSIPEKKIGLLYTVQFQELFKKVKKTLESEGKEVLIGKTALNPGQIIGCNLSNALSIEKEIDCFLLISSGRWHAFSLSLMTDKPIYIIIGDGKLERLETEAFKKKRKAAASKFLLSEKIGIIASTKPGQNHLKDALTIKKELIKKGKDAFLFIADSINPSELENFKIDFWINTACPGLIFDIPNVINLLEYKSMGKSIEKFK